MEVKAGYKQTDAGVIPEDWDVNTLESTTPQNRPNGIVDGPFGSNLKTIHYRKSGIPIITSGYVTEGKFFASEYLYVDKEKFSQEKRSAVNPGDIVMAKIGARCGASAILPNNHEIGILSGNALKITVDNSRHSTYYIWQILWNLYSKGNIEALRTVGAQPAISMANLKKFNIPLPPLLEQKTIAEALSDADALIEALEQLIVKKRQVKQGAMQELLTGKRRLPEFIKKQGYKETEIGIVPEDWEVKSINTIAQVVGGGTPSTQVDEYWHGHIPWISAGDISNAGGRYVKETEFYISELGLSNSSTKIMPKDTTIIIARGATVGRMVQLGKEMAFNQTCYCLLSNDGLDKNYLYYSMLFSVNSIIAMSFGTIFGTITTNSFRDWYIPLPSLPEQTAIAETLSDMDAEISALEGKLSKARQVKQGMMSVLLTGRIRLVESG